MNPDFERDGYKIVKNFISRDSADLLCCLCLKSVADGVAKPGDGLGYEHPYSWNNNNLSALDPLLCLFTEKMNQELDLDLVPTYYYQRTYLRGGALAHHTDRPSGERSVTMNLGQSHPWPIYIINRETRKHTEFQAEPGDALIYMGCTQDHWRYPFEGDWYCQLFLQWVERDGIQGPPHEGEKNEDYYWDKGTSPSEFREYYGKNWEKILHSRGIMERKENAAQYSMDEDKEGKFSEYRRRWKTNFGELAQN